MNEPERKILERILDFIRRAGCGHLTTIGPDGLPRTRAMEDHNPHEGPIFWFATPAGTR